MTEPDPAAPADRPGPSRGRDPRLLLVLVALAAFLVYVNALGNGFVFDDLHLVQNNEAIRDFRSIPDIFSENLWGFLGKATNYYRPLPPLVYMALYYAFGLTPWPFHLVNVLLHVGASLLVLAIGRGLLGEDSTRLPHPAVSPALLGALVFAVHPIHTEAVSWISGLMDVACTFFALLSFRLYQRSGHPALLDRAGIGSLVAFFVGALFKEPALVLPLLVTIHAATWGEPRRRGIRGVALGCLPYFGVLGVYVALRAWALRGEAPLAPTGVNEPAAALASVLFLFGRYLWTLLVPVGQTVVHHVEPILSLGEPRAILGAGVVVAYAAATVVAARRSRATLLGLAFLALPLAPALYLPALVQETALAFAERYLYFPSVGFAFLIGLGLARSRDAWPRSYAAMATVLLTVTVVFAAATVRRNPVWKDNVTLWTDAVQKSPESAATHENYGYALFFRGRPEEGRRELAIAMEMEPRLFDKIMANALRYSRKGLTKKATIEFNTALLLRPDSPEARYNLGIAYERQGWSEAALEQYRIAVELQPDFFEGRVNLGIAYAGAGRLPEAIEQLRRASDLRPGDASVRHNLARAYALAGLDEEAERERRRARDLDGP